MTEPRSDSPGDPRALVAGGLLDLAASPPGGPTVAEATQALRAVLRPSTPWVRADRGADVVGDAASGEAAAGWAPPDRPAGGLATTLAEAWSAALADRDEPSILRVSVADLAAADALAAVGAVDGVRLVPLIARPALRFFWRWPCGWASPPDPGRRPGWTGWRAAGMRASSTTCGASSIAFVLEHGGKRALLGADAHPDVMVPALRRYAEEVGEARVRIDLCKLPHHASDGNVTSELISVMDARRYLVSTNGDKFAHPDDVALARIIVSSKRPRTIYGNFATAGTTPWSIGGPALGATVVLPKPGRSGLRVSG